MANSYLDGIRDIHGEQQEGSLNHLTIKDHQNLGTDAQKDSGKSQLTITYEHDASYSTNLSHTAELCLVCEDDVKTETDDIEQPMLEPNIEDDNEGTNSQEEDSASYTCHLCSSSFSQQDALTHHYRKHSEDEFDWASPKQNFVEKPVKCKICHSSFLLKTNLKTHIQRKHSSGTSQCDVCGLTLKKRQMQYHMKIHTSTSKKPAICPVCRRTVCQRDLNYHLEQQHRDKGLHIDKITHKCELCNQTYSSRATLCKHVMSVHGALRPCSVCQKMLRKASFGSHMKIHTGEAGLKVFNCSVCQKSFQTKARLQEHMNLHTGEKTFKCSVCNETFGGSYLREKHMIEHTGLLKCKLCEKSYKTKAALHNHMKLTHSANRKEQHVCDICGKALTTKPGLQLHMRTHTGEKPFKCKYCDKSFAAPTSLTFHLRVHTGEKPFSCSFCNKKFSVRKTLVVHVRTHTGEKPFDCTSCQKRFSHKSNLNSHLKRHNVG